MDVGLSKVSGFSWHRSVILRLIIIVIACIGIAQGMAIYLTSMKDDVESIERFRQQHKATLKAQSEIIGNLVWRFQFDQLDRLVDTLMLEPSVADVHVRDTSGAVVAKAARPERLENVAPEEIVHISTDIVQRNNFIEEKAGTVDMTLTIRPLNNANHNIFLDKLFIFLVSAISIVVGTLLATRTMLSAPLAQLRQAIERSQSGERGVRVPSRKSDEVGVLFQSFNGYMQSSDQYSEAINAANRRLSELALKDELTSLYNRRAATEAFRAFKGRRNICVIFIDVDHFKSINDLYGHDGGDTLLRSLASRITANIDPFRAKAYRIGGDEFIVVREGLNSADEAQRVANELLEHISGTYEAKDQQLHIAVSIGVYFCEDELDSFDEVIAMTSRALRAAKSNGRNRVVLLDQNLRDEAMDRIVMVKAVQEALERGAFETYYQTRHSVATGVIVGAEALSRCVLPDRGIIGPGQFMPIIEETHHSLEHGRIVIEQTCKALGSFRQAFGGDFRLSINVNAQQLAQPEFWAYFEREREKYQLPASAFEVEITESSLIQNFLIANDVLVAFRKAGGLVALDDFGTGYSSLSYLTKLPIDIIKLDRGFVASGVGDSVNAGILEATVLLARSIGAEVVAEGVETDAEDAFLRVLGVDYLQGFRYSRPSPLPVILKMAEPRSAQASA